MATQFQTDLHGIVGEITKTEYEGGIKAIACEVHGRQARCVVCRLRLRSAESRRNMIGMSSSGFSGNSGAG